MHRVLASFALLGACADDTGIADGGVPCLTEHCANPEPEEFACRNVVDRSGRPPVQHILDDLDDPLARLILKRPGPCPTTYAETIAKWRLEDRARCQEGARVGMLGRIVSERSQLLGEPDQVRAVVSRTCARRAPYEVFFALPPIDSDNPELPEAPVHAVAFESGFDKFNFYTLDNTSEGGVWSFHGDSFDMIDGDPATGSECEACHADGGLVMREIVEPWVHWESGATRTQGSQQVIDRFSDLGARGAGPELAEVVRAGNRRWNETRRSRFSEELDVEAHGGSLRSLLAPLFCPTTYNLASAGGPDARGAPLPVTRFPATFFVDPAFERATETPFDRSTYEVALEVVGSRIDGIAGPRDTFFGFTFVTRARSDVDYVDTLINAGYVDEEFVLDVLSIDFTRPVFSAERCALLEFVPDFVDLDETEAPPPPATGGPLPRPCCEPSAGPGCDDADVQLCVCALDTFCCEGNWDQGCANLARNNCDACSQAHAEPGLGAAPRPRGALPEPDTLRNAMYARLDAASPAAGSTAAQLRDALATPRQAEAHRDRAERFLQACRDRALLRDEAVLVLDVLTVAARRRADARAHAPLLDTMGAVASDNLDPLPTARLDPNTCDLRTD